ncbi:hypothetical protein HY468_00920 [Candidatus Roizmanbacteria bacterium]|nr:hypothetical protein [Candidatus Roizmanbacteria bacterium]
MKKLSGFLLVIILIIVSSTTPAESVEFVISDNGNNSSNTVTTSIQESTTVSQQNAGSIENHVDSNANTGNNTTSTNTNNNTTIETGSISEQVSLTNEINQSTIDISCCPSDPASSLTITGNGENSTHTVSLSLISQNSLTVNQQATIQNNVNGSANTGNNNANNNNGNVKIKTGDVTITDKTINKNVNNASISFYTNKNDFKIKIAGNADSSTNMIALALRNDITSTINNAAHITNGNFWSLTTGDNNAFTNNGDIYMETGGINAYIVKVNDGINIGKVAMVCCKEKEENENEEAVTPPPPPPGIPPTIPPPPPSSSINPPVSSNNGGIGGSGQVLGASVGGEILPVTGTSWWLFATIANILMFLLGLYLRMRAGRSPCYEHTK